MHQRLTIDIPYKPKIILRKEVVRYIEIATFQALKLWHHNYARNLVVRMNVPYYTSLLVFLKTGLV